MQFTEILESKLNDNTKIEYGIVYGNENILLIKTGQDGSIYGYNDKYLKMANLVNEKTGATVICASNPFDGQNPLDDAMKIIKQYCQKKEYLNYKIFYLGFSSGGFIGAVFGIDYPQIEKMLLVNMPLMYNWHKIKSGLIKYNGQKLILVYGSQDQSVKYLELLQRINNEKIKTIIIPDQDHYFSNCEKIFEQLPLKYLFNVDDLSW